MPIIGTLREQRNGKWRPSHCLSDKRHQPLDDLLRILYGMGYDGATLVHRDGTSESIDFAESIPVFLTADDVKPVRCYQHKDRDTIPPLCPVCQRLAVEQDIVIRVIDAMLAAGYSLQTDILGGDARPAQPTKDRNVILSEMMAVDDEFLGVYDDDPEDDRPIGWVRFVYGNDGHDVVSDYTTNLESILAPINQYADTLG